MSQNDEPQELREPKAGMMFYGTNDEGEEEEMEIEEVVEVNVDGTWNIASGGDFYDIGWSNANERWEEAT